MKIRVGFVSNSSSSSFVLLVRKDAFNEWLENADPLKQAIVEATMSEDKVLGISCMIYERNSGDYSSFDNLNTNEIIERAKTLAEKKGRSLIKELAKEYNIKEDEIDDDWLHDTILGGLYRVKYNFNEHLKDGNAWSHEQDW